MALDMVPLLDASFGRSCDAAVAAVVFLLIKPPSVGTAGRLALSVGMCHILALALWPRELDATPSPPTPSCKDSESDCGTSL